MNPPHRGPHTVSPIVYDKVPNFGASALPRTYAFIVDEAGGAADMAPCPNGVRTGSYMLDITTETKPFPVSVWQVPVGNFCSKGGRFGPHQSAETVNGRINRFENKIAWLAYFNAGVRVRRSVAIRINLKELGYYIPKTNENSHPIDKEQPVAIQINDVDIDHRGLAYASDRVGTGLFILEYHGPHAVASRASFTSLADRLPLWRSLEWSRSPTRGVRRAAGDGTGSRAGQWVPACWRSVSLRRVRRPRRPAPMARR